MVFAVPSRYVHKHTHMYALHTHTHTPHTPIDLFTLTTRYPCRIDSLRSRQTAGNTTDQSQADSSWCRSRSTLTWRGLSILMRCCKAGSGAVLAQTKQWPTKSRMTPIASSWFGSCAVVWISCWVMLFMSRRRPTGYGPNQEKDRILSPQTHAARTLQPKRKEASTSRPLSNRIESNSTLSLSLCVCSPCT